LIKANESSSSKMVIRKPEQSGVLETSVRLKRFSPYVLSFDANDFKTMFGVLAIAVNFFVEEDV
jgi:hypothetical protein